MKKQMPYSTPEGYFEDLHKKLEAIPQSAHRATAWEKISPYLAMAAVFATAFIVGTTLLNKTRSAAPSADEMVEYLIASDVTLAQLTEAVYYLDE